MKQSLVGNRKQILAIIAMFAFILPVSARSEFTDGYESLLSLQFWISVAVILLVAGLMVYFLYKFRDDGTDKERPVIKNELKYEIGWTVATLILVIILFFVSIGPALDYQNTPENFTGETINVYGHQFYWSFEFENGSSFATVPDLENSTNPMTGNNFTTNFDPLEVRNPNTDRRYNALELNVGVTYRLNITGDNFGVIHSFFVPELSFKADAVPGSSNFVYLTITEPGEYWGACAELCGGGHYNMLFVIIAR